MRGTAAVLLLAAFGLAGCFSVRSNAHFSYAKVDGDTFARLLADSTDHVLIDVRTRGEHARAHLPGAINRSFLSFRYGRLVRDLDRSRLVLLYCQTCHRSPLAARRMKRMGFRRVVDLQGGFQRWKGPTTGDRTTNP